MIPPEWATRLGKRLSLETFAIEFSDAWNNLASRFLKLECWQTYQEQESNKSHSEYKLGNVANAAKMLENEAETDRPLYEGVKSRRLKYARVRLIKLPLTPYLRYEMISYRIREQMGENIEVVQVGSEVSLPNEEYFDFLLFDRTTALVHDYGTDGRQVGGWLVEDAETLERLERTTAQLRRHAVPIGRFLPSIGGK
ncbi:MAG: hypothetical protein GEV28_29935 [Actinophytocola sp.]|uniref:DUF6879 family protein n=1 Tax=Actinophytocola sp. TaxID=1872138 RepID=UPI001325B7A4|nr:DUF6879 family protein [Actinophytocola sp.]MPZ84386.1 hypothetical protein [Actinophytocola sp.]